MLRVLLVCEFSELLLRFDGENRQKRQLYDHSSIFPFSTRITSRLFRRLAGVSWRIIASRSTLRHRAVAVLNLNDMSSSPIGP